MYFDRFVHFLRIRGRQMAGIHSVQNWAHIHIHTRLKKGLLLQYKGCEFRRIPVGLLIRSLLEEVVDIQVEEGEVEHIGSSIALDRIQKYIRVEG